MYFNILFHPKAEKEYIRAYQWYEERLEGLGERFSTRYILKSKKF